MPVGPAGISGHLLAEDAALRTPHALAYSALSLLMLESPEMSAGIMGNAEWPLQHQQRQCRVRLSIRCLQSSILCKQVCQEPSC